MAPSESRGEVEQSAKQLVDELARVFHDPDEAQSLVLRAGLEGRHLVSFKVPWVFWDNVIRAAADGRVRGGVRAIVDEAARQAPHNEIFGSYRARLADHVAEPKEGGSNDRISLRIGGRRRAWLVLSLIAVLVLAVILVGVLLRSTLVFETLSAEQAVPLLDELPVTDDGREAFCGTARVKLVLKHGGRGSRTFDVTKVGLRSEPYTGGLSRACRFDPTGAHPAGILSAQSIKIRMGPHDGAVEARWVSSRTRSSSINPANWLEGDGTDIIVLNPGEEPIYYDVLVSNAHPEPRVVTFFVKYGPDEDNEVLAGPWVIAGGVDSKQSEVPPSKIPTVEPEPPSEADYTEMDPLTKLAEARRAAERNEYIEARRAASEIISDIELDRDLTKAQRLAASEALILLAELDAKEGAPESEIIATLDRAARLGHRDAMYQWVVHTVAGAHLGTVPSMPDRVLLEERCRDAATLGHLGAAEVLEAMVSRPEVDYWQMLRRVNEAPESFVDALPDFLRVISARDIDVLKAGMRSVGLSEIDALYTTKGLPGRSVFVAFQNDHLLRNRLDFVFRAFYDGKVVAEETVLEVFDEHRRAFARSGFSDYYAAVVAPMPDLQHPNVVVLDRKAIGSMLSPGDELVVRCDSDVHLATVWSVDRTAGFVEILDPFYEFWKPQQTPCTPSLLLETVYPERAIARISLQELTPMVLAIFSLRDAGDHSNDDGSR